MIARPPRGNQPPTRGLPTRFVPAPVVALEREARDLAPLLTGRELHQIQRRAEHAARVRVAWQLVERGWPLSAVARVLGYADHSTLSYHLSRINAQIAAGRWPWGAP